MEPDVDFYCDIDYDVFQMMKDNKFKYGKIFSCPHGQKLIWYLGWVMSLSEYIETVPTLWETTQQFMEKYPEYIERGNDSLLPWVIGDDGTYNLCHFWSNFEVILIIVDIECIIIIL